MNGQTQPGPQDQPGPARHGRRGWILATALLAFGVLAMGLHLTQDRMPVHPLAVSAARSTRTHPGAVVNGTFLTLAGTTSTVSQVRGGQPAMIWFVAGGCASCAASIPAVQENIQQLTGDGLIVISVGLYGDFPQGQTGVDQLREFADAAAPGALSHPGWIWGVGSRTLSETYDPSGTPDTYLLLNPNGQVRYRGSVPVSTMPELLAEAHSLGEAARTTAASSVPCC